MQTPAGTVTLNPLDANVTVRLAVFPEPDIAVTVPKTVSWSPLAPYGLPVMLNAGCAASLLCCTASASFPWCVNVAGVNAVPAVTMARPEGTVVPKLVVEITTATIETWSPRFTTFPKLFSAGMIKPSLGR